MLEMYLFNAIVSVGIKFAIQTHKKAKHDEKLPADFTENTPVHGTLHE